MHVNILPRLKIHRGKFPLRPIKDRLDDYIEFAYNTKKFSNGGFYVEVKEHIESLEQRIEELEKENDTLKKTKP